MNMAKVLTSGYLDNNDAKVFVLLKFCVQVSPNLVNKIAAFVQIEQSKYKKTRKSHLLVYCTFPKRNNTQQHTNIVKLTKNFLKKLNIFLAKHE